MFKTYGIEAERHHQVISAKDLIQRRTIEERRGLNATISTPKTAPSAAA